MYIDASHGVHHDGKSHTGAMIGIGDAIGINMKSSKQKVVTKSSTEAELVGVTGMAGEAMDLKAFVEGLGYSLDPPIIFQDNASSIYLLNK